MSETQHEYKAITAYSMVDGIEDERVVKQIFSVMGQIDDVGDVIKNGAYKKTLAERPDRIRVLWQHDAAAPPIGVPISLSEIGKSDLPKEMRAKYPDATGGLYGEVRYLDTPRGNEVLTGLRAGAIRENSIGFDPVKWETLSQRNQDSNWADEIRSISEIRLWDISPVNWGANPATQNMKSVCPFMASPKADEGMAWDGPAEMAKAATPAEWKAMCAWFDSENPENKGSYKLPHHTGDSGHKVVWNGVRAAMGAFMGGRGGVNMPEADRKGVYNHLSKHYAQFDKEPPDYKFLELADTVQLVQAMSDETLLRMTADLKSGRVLSAASLEKLKVALVTLTELLFTAEPPQKSDDEVSVEKSALARAELAALTAQTRLKIAEREYIASQVKTTIDMGQRN